MKTEESSAQEIPEIQRVEIDEEQVGRFTTEGEFMGLCVSLLVEAGSYVCLAGNIYSAERKTWSRDEAILGGHLVRLYKLIDAILDQNCKHRREISFVLSRLAFECIVNLRYLIAFASDDLFASYRSYSLQHERRLLAQIRENVKTRGGNELPIERRMINSVEKSFRVSGVPSSDQTIQKERNWGAKNIFERSKAVGLEQAYLAAFGGGSHSVHGNWQDLLEYHLRDVGESSFVGEFEWHMPRPQILEAIALHSVEAVIDFACYLAPDTSFGFVDLLRELQDRIILLSRLHEEFLSRGGANV